MKTFLGVPRLSRQQLGTLEVEQLISVSLGLPFRGDVEPAWHWLPDQKVRHMQHCLVQVAFETPYSDNLVTFGQFYLTGAIFVVRGHLSSDRILLIKLASRGVLDQARDSFVSQSRVKVDTNPVGFWVDLELFVENLLAAEVFPMPHHAHNVVRFHGEFKLVYPRRYDNFLVEQRRFLILRGRVLALRVSAALLGPKPRMTQQLLGFLGLGSRAHYVSCILAEAAIYLPTGPVLVCFESGVVATSVNFVLLRW